MVATFDQIEAALQAVWDAGWTGTANVSNSNAVFDPTSLPAGSYWVETETSSGQQQVLSLDDSFWSMPTLAVTVHIPLDIGKPFATQVLDMAAALYRGVQITAGTSTMRAYSFSKPMPVPKDGWYSMSMQISFKLF